MFYNIKKTIKRRCKSMSFMQRMLYKLRAFMMGRYGADQFGIALMVLGLVLSGVFSFTVPFPWFYLAYIPYFYGIYRMLSKNISARRKENDLFLKFWTPLAGWFKFRRTAFRDRKLYKYFKCPSCGLHLRAPRGKGKIQITCQRCHQKFCKKT